MGGGQPVKGSKEAPVDRLKDDHTGSVKEGQSKWVKSNRCKGGPCRSVKEAYQRHTYFDETDDNAQTDFDFGSENKFYLYLYVYIL
jgi:poly(3-hydroxybutyrate) depolymerase